MKIDFKKPFVGLDGKAVEPIENLNTLLGTYLGRSAKVEGASDLKAHDWAIRVFNEGDLDLDNADTETLTKFIENIPNTSLMVRAQLAACIRLAKDKPVTTTDAAKEPIKLPASSN